eukprot:1606584-Rhodomonas_salina.3
MKATIARAATRPASSFRCSVLCSLTPCKSSRSSKPLSTGPTRSESRDALSNGRDHAKRDDEQLHHDASGVMLWFVFKAASSSCHEWLVIMIQIIMTETE